MFVRESRSASWQLVVSFLQGCSDTDVLLILLNYFKELPSTTIFQTTEHLYNLHHIFERFTPQIYKASLGFNAFTAGGQTGKFNVYTKKCCWGAFMK